MKLTQHDAYAFRRVLSKMDIPQDLTLSPFVQALLSQLDCIHIDQHHQFVQRLISADAEMQQQVLYIDPKAPPPPDEDDHAYVEAYIHQVTTQANAAPPDLQRTNGSTDLLRTLHQLNQSQGYAAAKRHYEHHALAADAAFQTVQGLKNRLPMHYYDAEKIIQAGEITAIVGQPGAGKSFWTLNKVAELADTLSVIYVAAEGINPERLFALESARQNLISDNLLITDRPLDLTNPAAIETFVAAAAPHKPKVIAIDTFAACTPGIDENSSKDMQPVLNHIREYLIQRLGCAVLLVHHTTKDGKSFRGSSALRGNVANMYYLTQDDDLITLRSDKQRDSEPADDRCYRLVKFDTRTHPITGEQLSSAAMLPADKVVSHPQTDKLPRSQKTILEILSAFDKGLTTRALQDAADMSKTTLWRHIQKLSKVGYIQTGEKGEPVYLTESGRNALQNG